MMIINLILLFKKHHKIDNLKLNVLLLIEMNNFISYLF